MVNKDFNRLARQAQGLIADNNRLVAERDSQKRMCDQAMTRAGELIEILRTISYAPADQARDIARRALGERDEAEAAPVAKPKPTRKRTSAIS